MSAAVNSLTHSNLRDLTGRAEDVTTAVSVLPMQVSRALWCLKELGSIWNRSIKHKGIE